MFTEVSIPVSTKQETTVTHGNTPAGSDVTTDSDPATTTPASDTTASDVSGNTNTAVPRTEQAEPQLVSRMLLNDNKAGMEGLDREKINQIIYEASKGICANIFSYHLIVM